MYNWDSINGLTQYKDRKFVRGIGFLLFYGDQIIFDDVILIDLNVGAGYGLINDGKTFRYGFIGRSGFPLIFNYSIS
ncbi:hypothetical protein AT05_05345 [Schleiferia thermophila str. Yellowstone]|nr:hypothetical protein AT05_05345 [Schleiferia thermophila str. Yellowstone]GCD80313.1 hypothetical protein JCM30197_15600 [Schleiferia thermophila]